MIVATRMRKTWKPGKDGQFTRQLGWKHSRTSHKPVQTKFRLGSDLKEARRREVMLQQLWEYVERQTGEGGRAIWPGDILELAKQIIKITNSKSEIIFLPPLKDGDMTRRQPDNSKMKKILGRDLLGLSEGIQLLLDDSEFMKYIETN